MTGIVKICGIRSADPAVWAVDAGADLIGFVFAESRRRVESDDASRILHELRRRRPDHRCRSVGVLVDPRPDEVASLVREVGLDLVQIHGRVGLEPHDLAGAGLIVATNPPPGSAPGVVIDQIDREIRRVRPAFVLVDGFAPGRAGGTGRRADWDLARELAGRYPLMLAGGLTAANVGEAILTVRPSAVDVSGGVEVDGVKDRDAISLFVRAARAAFARVSGSSDAASLRG